MNQVFTAKWLLNELNLKNAGSGVNRLGTTLFNSKIKLTPHQIKASLFAFKSPTSKGVILADEVGLGKTIEAGIILAQLWYEKKARCIIISPASLMRQWASELYEKFSLETTIMDRKVYNARKKKGYDNPFKMKDSIVICSYQFASMCKDDIKLANFEVAIIDEAHKLRNVYNEKSITSNNIKYAVSGTKKVLLTATPIQNNLLDLYGLSTVIDDGIFGDKSIFRHKYIKNFEENKDELNERLSCFIQRTLRKQVQPYIKFTKRIPQTFTFTQTEQETEIYNDIRELISNSDEYEYLIPNKQKHLLLLILCKLMGSSVFSVVSTMETMLKRLEKVKETGNIDDLEQVEMGELEFDEYEDLLQDDEEETPKTINYEKLNQEIEKVKLIIAKAKLVKDESKYGTLKESLAYAFKHLSQLGAEEKVIIFTESRRTQEYLYKSLERDGYDNILLFNGVNNDKISSEIYDEWINKPSNADKVNNTRSVNMRSAIIDKFKESGKILIATEAGAEGLNLQFCSLLINYDLPWNPQRVEQRIGRCHRFGQKYDVVVVNFINSSNNVEQRIYELLNSKFRLFNEVFGSSDEILGNLDDGKDIEKSIMDIYMNCRTTEQINKAFDNLQDKYKDDIDATMKDTKKQILDNFEEDIQQYFTEMMNDAEKSISDVERAFWSLTKIILGDSAVFNDDQYSFYMKNEPLQVYKFTSRNENNECIDYSMNSKLGAEVIKQANSILHTKGVVDFDITNYPFNLTQVKKLKGKSGFISVKKLTIKSFENEEYLVLNGILDDGTRIDEDICKKLFRLNSRDLSYSYDENKITNELSLDVNQNINRIKEESQTKNNAYLTDEIKKINQWADDKIQGTQLAVETMREQRKELQKQSDLASNNQERERLENEILKLSNKIKQSWMNLAMAEEDIEIQRRSMISDIKKENMKEFELNDIFTIRFNVV
ncbi:MAG: DEAD/DEAH box helicase [Clostridia bacterium]|nr:DEAD/DEAH box helicase [Clostridia bacterium]